MNNEGFNNFESKKCDDLNDSARVQIKENIDLIQALQSVSLTYFFNFPTGIIKFNYIILAFIDKLQHLQTDTSNFVPRLTWSDENDIFYPEFNTFIKQWDSKRKRFHNVGWWKTGLPGVLNLENNYTKRESLVNYTLDLD